MIRLLVLLCVNLSIGFTMHQLTSPSLPWYHHKVKNFNRIKCNFVKYKITGCNDKYGLTCNNKTNDCVCKDDHPIKLSSSGICIRQKNINESCLSSLQCSHVYYSKCYPIKNSNFTVWQCKCSPKHWYSNQTGQCESKFKYEQPCLLDEQCDELNGIKCLNKTCLCSSNLFKFNYQHNRCVHINYTECPDGYKWSSFNLICEKVNYYSNRGVGRGGLGGRGTGSASGRSAGSRGWFKSKGKRDKNRVKIIKSNLILLLLIKLVDVINLIL